MVLLLNPLLNKSRILESLGELEKYIIILEVNKHGINMLSQVLAGA